MSRAPRTLADQPLPYLLDEAHSPPSNTGKQPSYIADHRQRLRSRFIDGGAAAMPDYEMLELVLFRAIPRRDVKRWRANCSTGSAISTASLPPPPPGCAMSKAWAKR